MKPLRKDLQALADDAAKIARTEMLDPAMNAYRHTRAAMVKSASRAERYTAQQCDRLAHQISARPFATVAIVFALGWLVASLVGRGSK